MGNLKVRSVAAFRAMSMAATLLACCLGSAARADEPFLGSFEICVQFGGLWSEAIDAYAKQLTLLGLIRSNASGSEWVTDPRTNSAFYMHLDGNALETNPPPLTAAQILVAYEPLFEASSRLNWSHSAGAGHLHLDLAPFKKDPTRFVNFLVWFHNEPLLQRIFQPVEGESTFLQMGMQEDFIRAVETFKAIPNPAWEDAVRIFSPLFTSKFQSIVLHENTLELRAIGNQKSPRAASLQLKFYEALWRQSESGHVDEVRRWTPEDYSAELFPDEAVEGRLENILDLLRLDHENYRGWLNAYAKNRRRAMERAQAALPPGGSPSDAAEKLALYRFDRKLLRSMLKSDKDFVRVQALTIVRMADWKGDPELKASVISLLRDPVENVRRSAYFRLSKTTWWQDAELKAAVLELLRSPDGKLRDIAIPGLKHLDLRTEAGLKELVIGTLRPQDALTSLQGTAWWKDAELRALVIKHAPVAPQHAALCLSKMDWPNDAELVSALLDSLATESPLAREEAIRAIGTLDWWASPAVKKKILSYLEDPDAGTRGAALAALRNAQWWEIRELRQTAAKQLTDPDARARSEAIKTVLTAEWWRYPETKEGVKAALESSDLRLRKPLLTQLKRDSKWLREPDLRALVFALEEDPEQEIEKLAREIGLLVRDMALESSMPLSYAVYARAHGFTGEIKPFANGSAPEENCGSLFSL